MRLFFFLFAAYFLLNSITKSIIVELWKFTYIMIGLNIFTIFICIITLIIQVHEEEIADDEDYLSQMKTVKYLFYSETIFQLLSFVIMLTILPAIYEDLKDIIFMAIGGDNLIW